MALTEADIVVGYSSRYESTGEHLGADAFFATPDGQSVLIGLTDAQHIRANGERGNHPSYVTESGSITGGTRRSASRNASGPGWDAVAGGRCGNRRGAAALLAGEFAERQWHREYWLSFRRELAELQCRR